jgi:hypothetical protein
MNDSLQHMSRRSFHCEAVAIVLDGAKAEAYAVATKALIRAAATIGSQVNEALTAIQAPRTHVLVQVYLKRTEASACGRAPSPSPSESTMSFASLTGPSAKRVEVDNTVSPPAPASAGGDEGIASFRANPASAASAQMANLAVFTNCTNHASIGGFGAEHISPIWNLALL